MPTGLFMVVFMVVMGLVMRWLVKSRDEVRPGRNARILQQPRGVLIIGMVEAGFFTAIALLGALFGEELSGVFLVVFLGFTLLGWALIGEYYRAWHELTPDGLHYRPLLRAEGTVKWRDVTRVSYSALLKWFVVEGRNGELARLSALLIGLPEFARQALAQAPPSSIGPDVWPLLEETAAGRPPSIWM